MSVARIVAAVVLLGCLVVGVVGAFVFLRFTGIQWRDAYQALEAAEPTLLEASIEGDAPLGMDVSRRLHARGTLMRLRYEQLDAQGEPVASYELRALVPRLPAFGEDAPQAEFGPVACGARCQAHLAESRAVLINRSGIAGIADEWILRMPVGRAFDLGKRGIDIQDLASDRSRSIPVSPLRVTLLEACEPQVQAGSAGQLEWTSSMVPLPREWRVTHWVEVRGCESMMNAPPAQAQLGPRIPMPEPPKRLRPSWPDPEPKWEAIKPMRAGRVQPLTLIVNEDWMRDHRQPMSFALLRACRYDAQANRWVTLPKPPRTAPIEPRDESFSGQRVAFEFPEMTALYFAEWRETRERGTVRLHSALIPAGPVACEENELPPPQGSEVVACVPEGGVARTRLVPAPGDTCVAN
jgi:hypothetical protein